MRTDQYGWNDLPNKKPDPHELATVARRYGMPILQLKRLRAHFWRDQLHHIIEQRKNGGK